jgi:hypothetical protein
VESIRKIGTYKIILNVIFNLITHCLIVFLYYINYNHGRARESPPLRATGQHVTVMCKLHR